MHRLIIPTIIGCLISALPCISLASPEKKLIKERILVIHATSSKKDKDPERISRRNAYNGLVEQLTDKGYRVVDKASAENCSIQIAATHDIDPVINRAAAYGLQYFAEYTIFFKTSTITKDKEESKGALVKISSRVVDNTSSQVITSKNADASSSGITVDDAIEKAGRAAGKKAAAAVIAALDKHFREMRDSGRIYTIVMESPTDEADLPGFLTVLERNPVIIAAKETESGGGKATFEIVFRGKRDQLDREILNAARELAWKLKKVRAEGNRSTWKIY